MIFLCLTFLSPSFMGLEIFFTFFNLESFGDEDLAYLGALVQHKNLLKY